MSYSIARTVPEEDHENYMTEKEAKEMTTGFNTHLKALSIQLDELEKVNKNYLLKIEKEIQRNNKLRALISEQKLKIREVDEQISEKSKKLKSVESKINEQLEKIPNSEIFQLPSDISDVDKIFDYFSQLQSTSIVLKTCSDLLLNHLKDKKAQLNTEDRCINCKKSYTRNQNYTNSCNYHPGKLKYFSCRGCGADPYYECCMKCSVCSKGCKVTHHTS